MYFVAGYAIILCMVTTQVRASLGGETKILVIEQTSAYSAAYEDTSKNHDEAQKIFNLFNSSLPRETVVQLAFLLKNNYDNDIQMLENQAENEWCVPEAATDFSQIRISFSQYITEKEANVLADLLGYALKVNIGSPDGVSKPTFLPETENVFPGSQDDNNDELWSVISFDYDTQDGIRSSPDFGAAFDEFDSYIKDGSPVRSSRRYNGTRLVEGLGHNLRPYVVEVK